MTIRGDSIAVDFAGTAAQVPTNLNNPFASTSSSAIACIKAVLTDPDIPFNEGAERAITVTAPYGSLVNPRPPAPVRARLLPSYRVVNAVMNALAGAVPDRVIAPGFDTTTVSCLSHRNDDGYNIYLEIFGGGYGAGPDNDGCDAVDSMLSNCSNIPDRGDGERLSRSSGSRTTACAPTRAAWDDTAAAWGSSGSTGSSTAT